jgi:hypothetical protein
MILRQDSIVEFSEFIQRKEGWFRLKEFLRGRTPKEVMISLGMGELYCRWLGIDEVLESIEEGMSYSEGIMTAYHETLELIESRLQQGYSTHDFDVDTLIPTPAIRIIPIILEQRKREVESAKIYYTLAGNRINIRNLKMTFYGMQLMRELQCTKFTRRISQEDFQRLKDTLAQSGLKIKEPRKK